MSKLKEVEMGYKDNEKITFFDFLSKRVFEKYQTPLKFVIMFNYGGYGTEIIPQRFKQCRMANHCAFDPASENWR